MLQVGPLPPTGGNHSNNSTPDVFSPAQSYLQKFGYMNETTDTAQNLISENIYSHAVMEFQRFAGLNETGRLRGLLVNRFPLTTFGFQGLLDEETINVMNAPRCGNKDKVGHSEEARRRKRYALQGSLIIEPIGAIRTPP